MRSKYGRLRRQSAQEKARQTEGGAMSLNDHIWYERHPDDEWIDEIRIRVVPRYKTSGLSGDEWRVGAVIEIYRKGLLIKERFLSRIEYAVSALGGTLLDLADEGCSNYDEFLKYCFQPGCSELGTVEYELIDEYYRGTSDVKPKQEWRKSVRRRFCTAHARRGDCGLEDSDANYWLASAPEGWVAHSELGAKAAESPSAAVYIEVDDVEDAVRFITGSDRGDSQ